MPTKRAVYPVEFKALNDATGQVEALVSIFGNVDLQGDRVVPGAFKKSIAEWKASGDPVPVVFSHEWGDLWSHIGVVDTLEETAKGLRAVYTLDINDNPAAAQTYKLLKRRSLKEHSFAYDVRDERRAKDGANELLDLDLIEIGPTLRGANPDTELLAVKSLVDDGPAKDQLDEAIVNKGVAEPDGEKAGRRLSQATQAEMRAIHDDMVALADRMESMMGDAEDMPKSAEKAEPDLEDTEGAEDATGDLDESETEDGEKAAEGPTVTLPDPTVLELRSRILEMRATTGVTT